MRQKEQVGVEIEQPRKRLDSIAHLFLSDLKNNAKESKNAASLRRYPPEQIRHHIGNQLNNKQLNDKQLAKDNNQSSSRQINDKFDDQANNESKNLPQSLVDNQPNSGSPAIENKDILYDEKYHNDKYHDDSDKYHNDRYYNDKYHSDKYKDDKYLNDKHCTDRDPEYGDEGGKIKVVVLFVSHLSAYMAEENILYKANSYNLAHILNLFRKKGRAAFLIGRGNCDSNTRNTSPFYELNIYSEDTEELVILPHLSTEQVDVDNVDEEFYKEWSLLADDIYILVDSDRDNLIKSYGLLKRLAAYSKKANIIFVAYNEMQAKYLYSRLKSTIEEFTTIKIELAGILTAEEIQLHKIKGAEAEYSHKPSIRFHNLSPKQLIKYAKKIIMEGKYLRGKGAKPLEEGKMSESEDTIKLITIDNLSKDELPYLGISIGRALLGRSYLPLESDLIDFIRSNNIPCARFTTEEKNSFVSLFLVSSENKEIIRWILENYPHKGDRIILIIEDPNEFEIRQLKSHFGKIEIIKSLRGTLNGKETLIISKGNLNGRLV